ncbi:hypothetical protein PCANC_08213 [Puccinia coronata f. sp. avenae]|uniref:Fcf2 pre-rRNA processing C-terminal domain-containing protein n=1 Tax=Puccinia coronata f. sp. avenae TaxID=200324 RepID=A0A2N5VKN2_9BASI|nr:hypothetical protein PCANC_08213 [Puccinia coronata f. sp. avenae]PLW50568.1 hypothetical protein PCASD_01509 [Puccinia coronata f. sp. avenae]
MVLTRSSYSRLGTPLASPLTNPNRPLSQTQSRRSKTPRNSLSSSRSTNTPSEPPLTPSQLQFGFDLIDRLAHQQEPTPSSQSHYLTPPSTSNPLGLELSSQSSPPHKLLSPIPPSLELSMSTQSNTQEQQHTTSPPPEKSPLKGSQPQLNHENHAEPTSSLPRHDHKNEIGATPQQHDHQNETEAISSSQPQPNHKSEFGTKDIPITLSPLDQASLDPSSDSDHHTTTVIHIPPPTSNPGPTLAINEQTPLSIRSDPSPSSSPSQNNSIHKDNHQEQDTDHDELVNTLLKSAKEKARLIEQRTITAGDMGASESSDCGSSVTLQNMIRLDHEEKLKLALSRPLRPSALTVQTTNSSLKSSSTSRQKLASNQPTPGNFDRLSSVKDRRLGFDAPASSSQKNARSHFEWHDLPVQELTRETKMEIQAMRLHRTLDPKSFVKGGIEKSLKEPMPTKFLFGHVIDGSMNSGAQPSAKKRSFVESLVQDDKSQEWAKKKYNVIQTVSGKNSGGKNFYKRVKENRLK